MNLRVFDTIDALNAFMREPLYAVPTRNSFPPYTILQSKDGNEARVEVALAGFTRDDVEVEIADGRLHIRGANKEVVQENWDVLHKGIAARRFDLTLAINSHFEGESAEMVDGILTITLRRTAGFSRRLEVQTPKALPAAKKQKVLEAA